jgi:hypothetical protein
MMTPVISAFLLHTYTIMSDDKLIPIPASETTMALITATERSFGIIVPFTTVK